MTPLAGQKVYAIADLEQYGSARTWRRIIASGAIGAVRIGGSWRIPEKALEEFLQERYRSPRVQPPPPDPWEAIEQVMGRQRSRKPVVGGEKDKQGTPSPQRRGRPKIAGY